MRIVGVAAGAAALAATAAITVSAGTTSGRGVNGGIAYTLQSGEGRDGQIRAVSADGRNDVLLAEPGANPQWSPDGSKLLFESSRRGDVDLWTAKWDGSGITEVTFSRGRDGDGSWSPDGLRIAFETDRNGASDIYLADADARERHRSQQTPASTAIPPGPPTARPSRSRATGRGRARYGSWRRPAATSVN